MPGRTWISPLALALIAALNLRAADTPLADLAASNADEIMRGVAARDQQMNSFSVQISRRTLSVNAKDDNRLPPIRPDRDGLALAVENDSAAPAQTATDKPAPATPQDPLQQMVTQDQMGGIVLIEGDKGVATGFVAKIHDILFVVTNLHVLGNNQKLKITTLQGKPLAVSGIVGAVGADIALLRITDPGTAPPPLTPATDVLKNAKIGDQVVVVGNRLGGGVVTQTAGQILGLGPDRIEIDAKFQPGNSGSPVIRVESGEVLGLATYEEETKLDAKDLTDKKTQVQPEKRWFAYRLDAVTKWETIDWNRWQTQMKSINTFRENSEDLLNFLRGDFTSASRNPTIKRNIQSFQAIVSNHTLAVGSGKQDPLAEPVQDLIRVVQSYATEGSKEFAEEKYYDFFRSQPYWETSVVEQVKFRQLLIQALKEATEDMRNFEVRISGDKGGN